MCCGLWGVFLIWNVLWHFWATVYKPLKSCISCVKSIQWNEYNSWNQWHNVISEGPRFKIFEGPPSRSAKSTSRAPYMHEFSRGSRACSFGKFLNLDSLKCHFLDFGERFHRILMVRKRHSVTYQRHWPMFLLYRLSLGAPIWPVGVGGPRVLPVWAHSSYATDWNATFR
jgi:hypothetical protein